MLPEPDPGFRSVRVRPATKLALDRFCRKSGLKRTDLVSAIVDWFLVQNPVTQQIVRGELSLEDVRDAARRAAELAAAEEVDLLTAPMQTAQGQARRQARRLVRSADAAAVRAAGGAPRGKRPRRIANDP